MPWKKVTFSPKVTERVGPHNLKTLAAMRYSASGRAKGFAVFYVPVAEGEIAYPTFYFSPVAARECDLLLRTFNSVRCSPPARDSIGVSLRVGSEKSWDLLKKTSESRSQRSGM